MSQKFANNAATALASAATSSATTLSVADGAVLPTLAAGEFFLLTLIGFDANGNENAWEIVKVTARSGNTLTAVRAQEGTVAQAWVTATRAEARLTAGSLGNLGGGAAVALAGPTSLYVTQQITLTITNYNAFSAYSVAASAGVVSRSGDVITYTAPSTASAVTLTVTMDGRAQNFPVSVLAAGVTTPSNASPADGATNIGQSPQLQSSAFASYGLSDTHAASRWRVYQAGTLVHDSGWVGSLTSYSVPSGVVQTSLTYSWTVEHRGASLGDSAPSAATSFATASTFGGRIGTPGTQGFGIGVCADAAWLTTLGLSEMTGTTDKTHANYGNYQHTNGSIVGFIPKFFYRLGSASSPVFGTYGANSCDIVGTETFADEAAANAAGYALHRAFVNNGVEVPGFFIDKYLASKDGTSSCKSVRYGVPISLTTSTTYTRSQDMTGCTGTLADAVVLSRARGAGWNGELIFQRDALARITQAHAQYSTGTSHCAWYDAAGTTNFPKGCNNNALADTNDASVTFVSAGDSGATGKPQTGSASNLAKTTHNGQANGIADVNGAMYQVLLGVTQAGTTATDTAADTTGTAYVLKRSARHAALTGGFGGATDAWGTTSSLAGNFDAITGFLPWLATTGWDYFGNGANGVFSGATSGTDYLRACSGIALTTGMSAAGTSQFGNDGNYRYTRANMYPYASGSWSHAANAGVFYRFWNSYRSNDNNNAGFRCSAYGN